MRALREALPTREGRTEILRVLDLRGVPFFMKAMIRKQLSQRPDEWCLLDWEGQIARSWPLERGVVNLLVFGEGGILVGRMETGAPEAESLASLAGLVEAAGGGS